MVIISFPNGTDWFKANWVFRQITEDVVAMFPDDAELKLLMEQAGALGGLSLESMKADLASRISRALRKVAESTIQGRTLGWRGTKPEDLDGHRMYLEAISELLSLINQQKSASGNLS